MKYTYYLVLLLLSACSIIKFSSNNKNHSETINTLSVIPEDWALLKVSNYNIFFSAVTLINNFSYNKTVIYPESTKNSIDSLFKKPHLVIKKINDFFLIDSTKIELGESIECQIDDLLKNGHVYIESDQGRIEKIKYTLIKPKTYGGIFSEWTTLDGLIINRVLLAIAIY